MADADSSPGFLAHPRFLLTAAVIGLVGAGFLAFATRSKPAPKSEVRVRNATSAVLHSVVIGSANYGDVGLGETTGYKSWGPAYATSRVEFVLNGRPMRHVPDDHVGESPLGGGAFTYVIGASAPKSDADFSVNVVRE